MHPTLSVPSAAALAAAALSLAPAPARAQILQSGDILVGGSVPVGFGATRGRIYRLRDGVTELIIDGAAMPVFPSHVGRMMIDAQGRIVFHTFGCGFNSNSSAIWRIDPATLVPEELACFPYVANPGNIPPGLPPDAQSFYLLSALYPTSSLRITIDDDVNGGIPQVGFVEGYGCAITTTRDNQTRPAAYRFLPSEARFENDVPLDLLSASGYAKIARDGSTTWYSNEHQVGKAQPDIVIDVHIDGDLGSFTGRLVARGRNELIMSGEVLDNTLIPNVSAECGDIEDDNIPDSLSGFAVLTGIQDIGVLDGGALFAMCNAGPRPYLFSLTPRAPFLNPFICLFYNADQYAGPIEFFQGWDTSHAIADGSRVLGTQPSAGRLIAVTPAGQGSELATGIPGAGGIAVYPPTGGVRTARNLTLRIDEPAANVLMIAPSGDRLGLDAAGAVVNDFGDEAMTLALGPGGTSPWVFTLAGPENGVWRVEAAGTADAPYSLHAYLADTSEGGTRDSEPGDADPGVTRLYRMIVGEPLELTLGAWCDADWNADGVVNSTDISGYLTAWLAGIQSGDPAADFNGDGMVNSSDISAMLTEWLAEVQTGC